MNMVSNLLNWELPLAERTAPHFVRWGWSANQVTLLTLIVGVVGVWEVAFGHVFAGAFLLWLARWGDHLDGKVARATGTSSKAGAYFDAFTGLVLMTSIMWAIGYRFDAPWLIYVGMVTAVMIRALAVVLSHVMESEHINVVHNFSDQYGELGYFLENEFGFVPVWTILPLALAGEIVLWGWLYTIGQLVFMVWLTRASWRYDHG